jgi:hypothetical protein
MKTLNPNNSKQPVSFPDISTCPICNSKIAPNYLASFTHLDEKSFSVYCECTFCRKPFLALFSNYTITSGGHPVYTLENLEYLAPKSLVEKTFENCINNLSPNFVKIYNQAYKAENLNLDQISGIGYRKALEFLIKDFLIKHEGKDSVKVKSTALGCCIDTMIDNPQLKTVASRATWLGNDQTHYEQKYQDKDIEDLKRLIDLSVH